MPRSTPTSLLLEEIKKHHIIPSGYLIDSNCRSRGDCFFGSVAKHLQIINNDTSISVESLRERCKVFLQKQLENIETKECIPQELKWIIDCLNPKDTQYKSALYVLQQHIIQIPFSEKDFLNNTRPLPSLSAPIWGDINLECRIICTLYNVVLYVLEKKTYDDDNKTIWYVQRIDHNGSKTIDLPNPIRKQDFILVNEGRNHFMPLLYSASTGMDSNHHKQLDKKGSNGNYFTYAEDNV